jgi:hypothetical protein
MLLSHRRRLLAARASCSRCTRILVVLAGSVVASTLATIPARAQTYTGAEVKAATDSSLDVMKDHVQFQATQDRYDAMLGYFAFTDRFAPMKFANADGTKTSKVANRAATMIGGGYGSTSKFGVYVGAWSDIITIAPGKNADPALQGYVFGGLAAYGFQASYGGFVSDKLQGLDPYGNFNPQGGANAGYTYVPGAGYSVSTPGAAKDAISVYHTSGASLILIRRNYPSEPGSPTKFGEVRAQLQPLKQWLDEKFGLPIVAVQQLKSDIDAYSSPKQIVANAVAPTVDSVKKPIEVEFGSDNLLASGIRAHAVMRFSPSGFRARAELGAYHDFPWGTAAFRSFLFARDTQVNASLDAFAQWSIIPASPPGESLGFPIAVAASYSFNSPESDTFVPLPYAHVFGAQVIIGVPDVAKRLVPIVRAKREAKDAKDTKVTKPEPAQPSVSP